MTNDADDVLPPVDVIRKRRLAEIAGLAIVGRVIDRDEYLKQTHTRVSMKTAIYRRNKKIVRYYIIG